MEKWFYKWGFKINEKKSTYVTFTLQKQICPQVSINNITVPNKDTVRYLGMTLDRRLTWKQLIVDKSKQFRDKLKKFYWLIGRRSKLSTRNKITLYKTVIKPGKKNQRDVAVYFAFYYFFESLPFGGFNA